MWSEIGLCNTLLKYFYFPISPNTSFLKKFLKILFLYLRERESLRSGRDKGRGTSRLPAGCGARWGHTTYWLDVELGPGPWHHDLSWSQTLSQLSDQVSQNTSVQASLTPVSLSSVEGWFWVSFLDRAFQSTSLLLSWDVAVQSFLTHIWHGIRSLISIMLSEISQAEKDYYIRFLSSMEPKN